MSITCNFIFIHVTYVLKEMRYPFTKFLHVIDSETVLLMLQKLSTRFNLYEGVRIGELQASTDGDVSMWACIAGEKNISDWVTRVKSPEEIDALSAWFSGYSYMTKPIEEWGLKFGQLNEEILLPGEKKPMSSHSLQSDFNLIKYSDFRRLLRVLARILSMFQRKKLRATKEALDPELSERKEKININIMSVC